jgi:hypothetical protein
MARKKSLKTKFKELLERNSLKKWLIRFKSIGFYGLFYGLLINYTLWAVWNIKFKWYSFPAYGIILFFLKSEFIYIFRWCFHKIPGVEPE